MLIYQSPNNPHSHLMIKERKRLSYPTKRLLSMGLIQGRVLDFGYDDGIEAAFLRQQHCAVVGYDPFHALEPPVGRFDTVLCRNVLTVLLPEEQAHVLMAVAELLKPEGRAYFTVRRGIKYTGFRTHPQLRVKVYQCDVTLPYRSIFRTVRYETYEYRHFNQLDHAAENNCPFCAPGSDRELITESAAVYAMLDGYPVAQGHTLVIPKQHTVDYFDLPESTKMACWMAVDRVKTLLVHRFGPDGFNVGINVGRAAGQTVPHVHIHVIPRYAGDVASPTGGVRNIIPGKGKYLLPGGGEGR